MTPIEAQQNVLSALRRTLTATRDMVTGYRGSDEYIEGQFAAWSYVWAVLDEMQGGLVKPDAQPIGETVHVEVFRNGQLFSRSNLHSLDSPPIKVSLTRNGYELQGVSEAGTVLTITADELLIKLTRKPTVDLAGVKL